MNGLHDEVAIVTGGGSGIGRALCIALAQQGARVIPADLDKEGAEETVRQILDTRGWASPSVIDVANEEDVERLVADVVSEHGRLDYMFNNAGIAVGGDARDLSLEHWDKVFAVNWQGVLFGTRFAYAHMTKQGFGHIVNVASLSGLLPHPFNTPYNASKHAVVGLSKGLRLEAADLGVRVSVVCPGYVETPILRTVKVLNVPDEKMRDFPRPKAISPARAAEHILDGVRRNKGIIAFPARERWIWRLYRLAPSLVEPRLLEHGRRLRRLRDEALRIGTPD